MKTKERSTKVAPSMPPVNAVLSLDQVAFGLSISLAKLHEMISTGEFPACDFYIGNSPKWRVKTFDAWVDSRAAAKPKER